MANSVDPEQTVPHCLLLYLMVSSARQLFAADDFSRQHFQMHFSWCFKLFFYTKQPSKASFFLFTNI